MISLIYRNFPRKKGFSAMLTAMILAIHVGGAEARITSADTDFLSVIPAPSSAESDGVCNDTKQIGFDERQGVLLVNPLRVQTINRITEAADAAEIAPIPAGTVVDSVENWDHEIKGSGVQ